MKPQITYVVAPICEFYISRFLYTLWKYSEPGTFKVVCIDQTKDGFSKPVMDYIKPLIHLYLHPPHYEFGYAKAMNEGLIHGLHWGTPYICLSNDDIEIMDSRWIQGIWDTFKLDPERILGVVPMAPRHAGWGYGVSYNPEVLPYKTEYTKEDYDYLLNGDFTNYQGELPKTFPRKLKGTVVDGAVFIMPYFKREAFEKLGLLDERFWPGSGEDMDFMARAYAQDYRIVSTSYSWIWHEWSKSKDLFASGELEQPYYKPKHHQYWNNMGEVWRPQDNEGHEHDPWGHYVNSKGEKVPLKRVSEVFVDEPL
jgi:GT2 family glycosyltransferase